MSKIYRRYHVRTYVRTAISSTHVHQKKYVHATPNKIEKCAETLYSTNVPVFGAPIFPATFSRPSLTEVEIFIF